MTRIESELLAILVCPLAKTPLVQHGERLVSTDNKTRRAYPLVEGIPDLLIEHGIELPEAEWQEIIKASGIQ